jgi:hypothetical protein
MLRMDDHAPSNLLFWTRNVDLGETGNAATLEMSKSEDFM